MDGFFWKGKGILIYLQLISSKRKLKHFKVMVLAKRLETQGMKIKIVIF
jgi:hypothetical protein